MALFRELNSISSSLYFCKAIARAWAQAGAARTVRVGRTTDTLDLTVNNVSEIDASVPVVAEPAKVSDEYRESSRCLLARVKTKFGKSPCSLHQLR